MSWYLDNVYDLNKESPYTFYVPSSEVLDKLKVGDFVKLIFVTEKAEDDDFLNDNENFQILSLGVILNFDDSRLEFIQESPLCAYERNDDGEFYKIDDYDWEGYLNS